MTFQPSQFSDPGVAPGEWAWENAGKKKKAVVAPVAEELPTEKDVGIGMLASAAAIAVALGGVSGAAAGVVTGHGARVGGQIGVVSSLLAVGLNMGLKAVGSGLKGGE